MAAVSSTSTSPSLLVSANDSNKRLAQPKPPEESSSGVSSSVSADKAAAKKAYEQPPRPTTNAQGQKLGQVVNEAA